MPLDDCFLVVKSWWAEALSSITAVVLLQCSYIDRPVHKPLHQWQSLIEMGIIDTTFLGAVL